MRELAWSFDRRGQRLALTVSPRVRAQDGGLDDTPTTLPGDELIVIYNVFFSQSYVLAQAGFFARRLTGRPYDIHFGQRVEMALACKCLGKWRDHGVPVALSIATTKNDRSSQQTTVNKTCIFCCCWLWWW